MKRATLKKPASKNHRNHVVFYLNGERCEVGAAHSGMMLADYLRRVRRLTGTKIVCAEGDCGACSVLRLYANAPLPLSKRFLVMNSCITPVTQMDGSSLVTVDALAREDHEKLELTPVQHAMVHAHGSQCGFCTPGFVMALTGLVEKKICEKKARGHCSPQEAKNATTGNLCRCTGYQPIIDAATDIDLSKCKSIYDRFTTKTQWADLKKTQKSPIYSEGETFSFYAPTKLADAARYLAKHRDARLISASTDLGVVHNKGKIQLTKLVSLHLIPELYRLQQTGKRVRVGARVSLAELRRGIKKSVPEFARFLDLFASPQIKNVATLIGNVGNASPIADTPPFLLVANATVLLHGPRGKRKLPLERFYLGYRKTALKPGEFITAIEFDVPKKDESVALYKTSQRKDLDISAVNAAFRVKWKTSGRGKPKRVAEIRLAMGGVAATPLRLRQTEKILQGKHLAPETFVKAVTTLHAEMNPLSDLRGTTAFRRVLVENFFHRFFREHAGVKIGVRS